MLKAKARREGDGRAINGPVPVLAIPDVRSILKACPANHLRRQSDPAGAIGNYPAWILASGRNSPGLDRQVAQHSKAAEAAFAVKRPPALVVFTRPEGIGPELFNLRLHEFEEGDGSIIAHRRNTSEMLVDNVSDILKARTGVVQRSQVAAFLAKRNRRAFSVAVPSALTRRRNISIEAGPFQNSWRQGAIKAIVGKAVGIAGRVTDLILVQAKPLLDCQVAKNTKTTEAVAAM
jgi:hypothetical protein